MECALVSVTKQSFFPNENKYIYIPFIYMSYQYHRSIIVTWLIVTISAIPVGISHGIEEYYNHKNEIYTTCQFLSDESYNHAAFQVSSERIVSDYQHDRSTFFSSDLTTYLEMLYFILLLSCHGPKKNLWTYWSVKSVSYFKFSYFILRFPFSSHPTSSP